MDSRIIFVCLLLATCSLALPVQPIDEDKVLEVFVDILGNGTNVQRTIISKVNETICNIDELMNRVENRLTELSADMGIVNVEKIEIVHSAFESYRKSKLALRKARNKLRRLANKTIIATNDLILYMEAWDKKTPVNEQKTYLEEQMKILKNLVEESDVILQDAKTTYDQAYDDIDSVIFQLKRFKTGIEKIIAKAREDKTPSALDIFQLLLCTTTGTLCTNNIVFKISKIIALEEKMDKNIEDIDDILIRTQNITKFIQEETVVIDKWKNNVDQMSNKLDDVKDESFYRLSLKRISLTNALAGLREATQEFLDRPEGIFGKQLL